jgi:hypothetical protein
MALLEASSGRMLLRFVSGRPVSQVTTDLSSVVVRAGSSTGQKRADTDLG